MKEKIKEFLRNLATKNYVFKKAYTYLVEKYLYFKYKKISRENPTNEKIVMFEAFLGKQCACSPKAIYEYMLQDERFADYTFVWAFRENKLKKMKKQLKNPQTIVVEYKSKKYYKYFAKAKYWITNWRIPLYMTKKPDQILIETWHGTPLKKIGLDQNIESNPLASQKKSHKMYIDDAKRYDYFVSPSAFCTRVFATSFGLDQLHKEDILIETGYPRNDFLLNYTQEDVGKIKKKLKIPQDKKVILYAPTWRDNQHTLGVGNTLDIEDHFYRFLDMIGEEYVVIVRLHYLIASKVNLSAYKGRVFNFSSLDDINQLYVISDILITDYSSVFFDYANLHRPVLFYMYDLEEYSTQVREFYIDLEELPGPILKTQEELLAAVSDIENIEKRYQEKYQKFCDTYNYLDDGMASKRVAELCIRAE